MRSLTLIAVLLLHLAAQTRPAANKAAVDQMMKEVSNWGRWGKSDQLGTINLVTPAKRKAAAALVRDGISVSLAHDTIKDRMPDADSPFEHVMSSTGEKALEGKWSIDRYSVLYHGLAHTHMDSLCHMFHDGKMYNGYSQKEVSSSGAGRLAITNFKQGIFTRGILMDIPALKGVKYLEPGTPIYPEDLEEWEKRAGVRVSAGDVVFIRTGRWAHRAENGPGKGDKFAGLHFSCAKWLRQRDVAMLGSDAASDVLPSRVEGVSHPVHQLVLIGMGTPIFDNCDLEALSAEAARRRRYEFLITAAPIPVPGGTGSPLNPIATF